MVLTREPTAVRAERETVQIPTFEATRPTLERPPAAARRASPGEARTSPGLLSRLFWVAVGVGIATTGFALVLSVFLAFIGLPLFVFGLGLVQSQVR